MPIQTAADSISNSAGSPYGFKNRIINGSMVIDQRNAGASVSVGNGTPKYPVDRYFCDNSNGAATITYSAQQVSDAPSGFSYSLKATTTTSGTTASSDYQYIRQNIEGYNFADFQFGTANAQTFTISFWVKSSLTGTFGGYLGSSGNTRFRTFNYTISSANTWEYKTVTITGDTSGTWVGATNGVGLQVAFSLACGTTYQGATGAWGSTLYLGATGQVNLTATASATWQVTGVQLEKGSQATAFDYRDYGTELALCQRYFEVGGNNAPTQVENGGTNVWISIQYKVNKRATPTFGLTSASNLALRYYGTAGYYVTGAAYVTGYISTTSAMVRYSGFSGLTTSAVMFTSGTADATPAVDPFSISAEL